MEFLVVTQGPFDGGAVRYDIGPGSRRDAPIVQSCEHIDDPNPPMLGAVWSDTGEAIPLGYERGEVSVRLTDDEQPDRRQDAQDGPLTEFLAGEKP